MTVACPTRRRLTLLPGEKPAPFPLRIRTSDGAEFDFDADRFPLAPGRSAGLAEALVRTCAARRIQTLDGWVIEPDGQRRRVPLATTSITWIDDRRDLA